MSSVIKKKSAFTPKAAKRGNRRVLETPPSTQDTATQSGSESFPYSLTPPSTQPSAPGSTIQNTQKHQPIAHLAEDPHSRENVQTPQNSQNPQNPHIPQGISQTTQIHSDSPQNTGSQADNSQEARADSTLSLSAYSIANVLPKAAKEASVDPMSKVPNSAVASDDENDDANENDYGDNDIFKHPMAPETRRRSSVANLRRLSGMSGFRRLSTFSATPDASDDAPGPAPVTIGIPVTKPTRKRKASTSLRRKSARSSIIGVPEPSDSLREESEESVPGTTVKHISRDTNGSEAGVVVGLDPVTNKFRKFRSSAAVEGHRNLPIAPENLVTSISSVKQLPKSIKKEDEHLFASVAVESESLSMFDLCKPSFKIGEVSEKFQMAEDAKVKIAQRRDERRRARVLARKQGISYEKALFSIQYPTGEKGTEEAQPGAIDLSNEAINRQESSNNNVQLQLVNGALIVDTDSQVVSRGSAFGPDNRTVEIENPFENPVTSRTYTKSAHTDAWTTKDVIRLYNALSSWGTDFTFIAQLFPYRTRRQIKSKFILEEKNNPQLVELALRRKLPADFGSFCEKVSKNYEIKSVEDFNKEMAELRKTHEAHLEEINTERERAIKEDLETNRKREIELRAGTKPGSRKDRIRELRKGEVVVGTIDDVKRSRESMEAGL